VLIANQKTESKKEQGTYCMAKLNFRLEEACTSTTDPCYHWLLYSPVAMPQLANTHHDPPTLPKPQSSLPEHSIKKPCKLM